MQSQARIDTLAPLVRVDVRPEHTLDDYAAVASLAAATAELKAEAADLRRMGQAAQRRVHDGFLVLSQLRSWGQPHGGARATRERWLAAQDT